MDDILIEELELGALLLFMNLCREVIDHERIQTNEAKAKAVKPELERLITLAKKGDGHSRRLAMARLGQDKFVVYKLFEEIAPRYAEREGGDARIPQAGAARVGLHRDGVPGAGLDPADPHR
ncbi:MAG: 50S ribosomal protein L17 [Thermoleophilaceae bacterium]